MSIPCRISLVTPSLNQGKFIRATIESVLSQGYPDLDYRVQDGGSTDGTLAVLREYEPRVAFVSEKDRGQADAINRGLSKATGEVLGYLNSDDVLLPGALAAVGEAFASDPELMFVWGRASYLDEAGSVGLAVPGEARRRSSASRTPASSRSPRRSSGGRSGRRSGRSTSRSITRWTTTTGCGIAARYPRSKMRFLDRELAGCRMHADAKTVAGWTPRARRDLRAREEAHGLRVALVVRGEVGPPHDGRSQATDPHPVPWRAYPPALLEFLRRNPMRLWGRGLKGAFGALGKRLNRV